MYLGRYSVGDSVFLSIPARTPNGAQAVLDYEPICGFYDGTSRRGVANLHVNRVDRKSFVVNHIIPASLESPGIVKYSLIYSWVVNGNTFNATDTMDIVPTDTSYGQIIGLFGVQMTGGQWVITQTDYHGLSLGFNPSDN